MLVLCFGLVWFGLVCVSVLCILLSRSFESVESLTTAVIKTALWRTVSVRASTCSICPTIAENPVGYLSARGGPTVPTNTLHKKTFQKQLATECICAYSIYIDCNLYFALIALCACIDIILFSIPKLSNEYPSLHNYPGYQTLYLPPNHYYYCYYPQTPLLPWSQPMQNAFQLLQ